MCAREVCEDKAGSCMGPQLYVWPCAEMVVCFLRLVVPSAFETFSKELGHSTVIIVKFSDLNMHQLMNRIQLLDH